MKRSTLALTAVLFCSSCASTLGYVFDPAIDSDKLGDEKQPNKIKAMKGDRRLLRAHLAGSDVYEVCSETHADAIGARSGSTKVALVDKASFDDALTEALTKTNERSAPSDIVRHLHWHTCNAYMNGWLTRQEYADELKAIRVGAFSALAPAADKKQVQPVVKDESGVTTTTTTVSKAK